MHQHPKLSVEPLLLTGFALIIALTMALTLTSLYYLVNYGSNLTQTVRVQNLKQKYVNTMRSAAMARLHNLYAMVLSDDPFEQEHYHQSARKQAPTFIKARNNLQQLDLSAQEKQQLETIIQLADNTLESTYETIELYGDRQLPQARINMMQKVVPQFEGLLAQLEQFIARQQAQYRTASLEAASKFKSTFTVLMPLGLLTIILIFLIAAFVSARINQSVTKLSDFTRRLELTEERENLILQGLFDAVITSDEQGYIQDFNPSAERMFGYDAKEIIGSRVNRLMPEAYAKLHDTYMANYTSTGKTTAMGRGRALLGRRKDGSVFPIDVALTEFCLQDKRLFIGTVRDITEQKEFEDALCRAQEELEQRVTQRTAELRTANEKLEKLANFDTLTELPNRSMFAEQFRQALSRANRYHHKLAVLYMDLDGFKQTNDSLGHKVGDALLQEVAKRLNKSTLEEDILARIGGDEFALLAININDAEDAIIIAQKIISAINKPFELSGQPVDIGISIGSSRFPEEGVDIDSLMHQADLAMYRAKQNGKNRYHYANENNDATA